VTFSYHHGQPVLSDVCFTVTPGQTLALVGPNGSGKSTLCALLPRLFDPTSGSITIDAQKLSRFTLESIREQIGVVLQQPLLFAGTVRENIAYGKFDATEQEIVAAAEAADADEFIRSLPDGYDTKVGERGDTLSGGQRQKLALARVIIKDPSMLVLDEPTASLDAASAAQVNATLRELSRRRTTLWVSHRLADVQHADVILVLEDGRVTQRGRHDDLVRQGGWYRDMFLLQSGESYEPAAGSPVVVKMRRGA
jgi:ATP-binding cassette subfamily B protein